MKVEKEIVVWLALFGAYALGLVVTESQLWITGGILAGSMAAVGAGWLTAYVEGE